MLPVNLLRLERFHETFRLRMVSGITTKAHGNHNALRAARNQATAITLRLGHLGSHSELGL